MALTLRDLGTLARLSRPMNLLMGLMSFFLGGLLSAGGRLEPLLRPLAALEGALLLLIMATGYWINDAVDFKIDLVNKPQRALVNRQISTKKVLSAYFTASALLALASIVLLPVPLALLNLLAMFLLYVYSQAFKRTSVIGNLIISLLAAMVILAGAQLQPQYKLAVVWAMVFAFLITFLRELTKDLEDIRGDLQFHLRTLPIQAGMRVAKRVLAASHVLMILATVAPVIVHRLLWEEWLVRYGLAAVLLVQLPLLGNLYLIARASRPRDFRLPSHLLKGIMLTGMASLLLLVY